MIKFFKCLHPDNVLSPVADCQAKHRGKCSTYALGVECRNYNRAGGLVFNYFFTLCCIKIISIILYNSENWYLIPVVEGLNYST